MPSSSTTSSVTRRLAFLSVLACVAAVLSVPLLGSSAEAAARPARVSGVRLSVAPPSTLKVAWRAARRATRYQVIVSRNSAMTSPKVYTTRSRAKTLSVNHSHSHCIQVRGVRGKRTYGARSAVRCTVAKGSTPWADQQELAQTGAGLRATVRLRFRALSQATSYEIDYAPSSNGGVVEVQRSAAKRTVIVPAAGSGLQSVSIGGLEPGKTYCFQLRGRGPGGNGLRGTRRCKVTMSAGRVQPATATPLVVGTFNTCSSTCSGWDRRRSGVAARIREMQLNGRAADVVAIQEGWNATDALASDLNNTFVEGCRSGSRLQSLFVRSSTYKVMPGTRGEMTFEGYNDAGHGACWVRVKHLDTGTEIVVASVHLFNGATGDTLRGREMRDVRDRVARASNGAPVVFAGDYNSNRSRAVDAPRIELAQIGAEDSYDQAASYQSPPYLNSACSSFVPCQSWMWGDHVDRVFVTPGIRVGAWKVDYRMTSGGRYVSPALSDHNPVLVSLQVL